MTKVVANGTLNGASQRSSIRDIQVTNGKNMIAAYQKQLLRFYSNYLRSLVAGSVFEPIILRGEKHKPDNTVDLHAAIKMFQRYEKSINGYGWQIEWQSWSSKKLGQQQWPARILVDTEDDYIALLGKQEEVAAFKDRLHSLLQWQPAIHPILEKHPLYLLQYADRWDDIVNVVNILLTKDVSGFYIRSIPVPVHTKFLEDSTNKLLITALLKAVAPDRYNAASASLDAMLGLKRKDYIFLLRWLDTDLAKRYMHGMELTGVTADWLRNSTWDINEVWLVENETNLHMLPPRPGAVAIFSRGKATHALKEIPLFHKVQLYYWGDLDEEGYRMLHAMHGFYPNLVSVFMDEATLLQHAAEMGKQSPYTIQSLSHLTKEETAAFNILRYHDGRLEQEKIRQDYMAEVLERM